MYFGLPFFSVPPIPEYNNWIVHVYECKTIQRWCQIWNQVLNLVSVADSAFHSIHNDIGGP